MAAYNHGSGACDYNTGSDNGGRIKSPPFLVTGDHPFILAFNYKRQMDPTVDTTCAWIVDADTGDWDSIGCVFDNSGTLQFAEMGVPNSPFWAGREVRIEFEFIANQFGNNNPGWFVDNVEVLNSGNDPPIPTVSEWGLVVMTLLLLTSGTLALRHRRSRAA